MLPLGENLVVKCSLDWLHNWWGSVQNEMWGPLFKGREKGSNIERFFLFSSVSLSTSYGMFYLSFINFK